MRKAVLASPKMVSWLFNISYGCSFLFTLKWLWEDISHHDFHHHYHQCHMHAIIIKTIANIDRLCTMCWAFSELFIHIYYIFYIYINIHMYILIYILSHVILTTTPWHSTIVISILQMRTLITERLSDLFKVTRLLHSRAKSQTQGLWLYYSST